MKTMAYQRKNNDNMIIDINTDVRPEMSSNYSFLNYAKAGLAVVGTVGTVALAQKAGFLPSLPRGRDEATPCKTIDNSHQMVSFQDVVLLGEHSLPMLPKHAKRAFGNEFQVNTYTSSLQERPAIAVLGTGDFVVVWGSDGQDGNLYGIFGQRYSSIGVSQGSEFQINTYTTGNQQYPSVAALTSGGFVVVWHSNGQDGNLYGIFGQRYSSIGVPQGSEFQINTYTTGNQQYPSVAALTSGGFVVVWHSNGQDGNGYGIFGQRFSNIGVAQGSEFQINTYTISDQQSPAIAVLNSGDFVVTWASYGQDGDKDGIYAQRYSSTAVLQGSEFQVNTYTKLEQQAPALAALPSGDFVVIWQSIGQDFNNKNGVFGKRFSSTGIPQGNEFQINTYSNDHQGSPSVAAWNSGDFVVVWESFGQDGSDYGIYGQRFSTTGMPQGNEFQLNSYTAGAQQYSSITAWNSGDFVAVWESFGQDGDNKGIYGRLYTNEAPVIGDNVLTVNEGQTVILSTSDLSASDIDNTLAQLTFTISNVQNGQFERVSNAGIPITSFTQQDIIDSNIQFVHDGGEIQPSYDVSVSDGALTDGPASASITFSNNVNDAPILVNNLLTINEGQIIILSTSNLSASDLDNTASQLTFTMSNVQNGQFERVSNAGISITSFTQQDIIDSNIQFIHDGGEIQPSYDASVSDGALTDGPASASITFFNLNDTPILGNNILTVNEGQTVILSTSNLSASDLDNTASQLTFTMSNVQNGQFERVSNPGVAITNFVQQDIIDGTIRFVHDGSTNQPTYQVSVSDGLLSSTPSSPNVTFTFVNDAPVLGNNALTVTEGETVILSTANLSATDIDHNDADLTFIISNLQYGQFERISNPGVAITSFTQQDVIDSAIQFVHDSSDNQPFYTVVVSDGDLSDAPTTPQITFTGINDAPSLAINPFILERGESILITPTLLNAIDSDNNNSELTINIASSNNGYFRTATTDAAITQFTMEQIINNEILFVSDSTSMPACILDVDDGSLTSPSVNSVILYIAQNQLVTKPGGIMALSSKQLDIQTQIAPTDLKISVPTMVYSRFEKSNNQGVPISSFTLEELNSETILFMQIGATKAPQFTLAFEDIVKNYTFPRTIDVNVVLNYPPEVLNPVGTLRWPLNKLSNYTVPVTLFSDTDGDPLQFSVKELNGNALPPWVQFDSAQNILEGTPTTDGLYSFKIIAVDPYNETAEDRFYLDVRSNYDTESINPVPIVVAIAGGAALLAGSVAVGILYFKKAQDKKTRQQHKFAQLIRHHLKLKDIGNFKSQDGQHFIQAVQSLSDLLYETHGMDIANMDNNRLDALARDIAAAAKNKISPATVGLWKKSNITTQEFTDNIHEIAKDNRLSGLGRHGDDVNIPMHTIDNTADNNFGTLVEEGVGTIHQIFLPKAEFV